MHGTRFSSLLFIPELATNLFYGSSNKKALQQHLAKRKIFCCGTVRENRVSGIKNSQLKDKELIKKGRGASEEKRLISDESDISYVGWFDSRVVNMLSSFAWNKSYF